ERLSLEGARAIFGEHRLLLVLFEHLYEAAEREDAEAVLRLAAADTQDLRAEADGEGEHLHAKDLRPHEGAELIDEDEHGAEEGEVEQVHGGARFTYARPASGARPSGTASKTLGPARSSGSARRAACARGRGARALRSARRCRCAAHASGGARARGRGAAL